MNTIKEIKSNDSSYKYVKQELETLLHSEMYDISNQIHKSISLLWLLPNTEKRNALQNKLYELSQEASDMLDNELTAYEEEWELKA